MISFPLPGIPSKPGAPPPETAAKSRMRRQTPILCRGCTEEYYPRIKSAFFLPALFAAVSDRKRGRMRRFLDCDRTRPFRPSPHILPARSVFCQFRRSRYCSGASYFCPRMLRRSLKETSSRTAAARPAAAQSASSRLPSPAEAIRPAAHRPRIPSRG